MDGGSIAAAWRWRPPPTRGYCLSPLLMQLFLRVLGGGRRAAPLRHVEIHKDDFL